MNPAVLLVGNFLSTHRSTPQPCEQLADRLEVEGWSVVRTSRQRLRAPRILAMVTTVLAQREKFDVAYLDVFSGHAFIWADIVSRLLHWLGKPMVLALHGGALPQLAERHPQRIARLLERAAVVTAPSGFLAEELSAARPDIRVVHNGFDLDTFRFRQRTSAEPNLVWVRAFHEIYAPQDAVRVLHRVRQTHPRATLTMLGADKDGSLRKTAALAESLGVADSVHFPGSVAAEQVAHHLDRADVFINTSTVDNAPRSLVEAMSCGLCIVSTAVGGVPFLIEHQAQGLLVEPGQPEQMADAVLRILETPTLAEHLCANARSQACRYDWGSVLPVWCQLLTEVKARAVATPEVCHVRS